SGRSALPQERPVVLDDGLQSVAGDRRLGETRLQSSVFLGRAGFLHAVILGLLVDLMDIKKSHRRNEQAKGERRYSCGKQSDAREADAAVLDVALPQPRLLPAHHQVSPALETETLPGLGCDERY